MPEATRERRNEQWRRIADETSEFDGDCVCVCRDGDFAGVSFCRCSQMCAPSMNALMRLSDAAAAVGGGAEAANVDDALALQSTDSATEQQQHQPQQR